MVCFPWRSLRHFTLPHQSQVRDTGTVSFSRISVVRENGSRFTYSAMLHPVYLDGNTRTSIHDIGSVDLDMDLTPPPRESRVPYIGVAVAHAYALGAKRPYGTLTMV